MNCLFMRVQNNMRPFPALVGKISIYFMAECIFN
jgi:hypothetical protein